MLPSGFNRLMEGSEGLRVKAEHAAHTSVIPNENGSPVSAAAQHSWMDACGQLIRAQRGLRAGPHTPPSARHSSWTEWLPASSV